MSYLIAISGGSGSGKTTLAERLAQLVAPRSVAVVSEDRYYIDTGSVPGFNAATFDFDDVAARDYDLMIRHLQDLKNGKAVEAPNYCFVTHSRKRDTYAVQSADIIVFEGIHLLHDPKVRGLFDLKIFVDAPGDLRFIRRLIRDTRTESEGGRGRDWQGVVDQYLGTVRPSHAKFTEPGRDQADILILNDADLKKTDLKKLDELLAPVLKKLSL